MILSKFTQYNFQDDLLILISFCYRERVHDNKEFSRLNSKPRRESQIATR